MPILFALSVVSLAFTETTSHNLTSEYLKPYDNKSYLLDLGYQSISSIGRGALREFTVLKKLYLHKNEITLIGGHFSINQEAWMSCHCI
jgi:hypothetical protein